MWKCPICSNDEKSRYICKKCGYDMRADFVKLKTLYPVPHRDKQERIKMLSNAAKRNDNVDDVVEKKLRQADEVEKQRRRREEEGERQQLLRLEEEKLRLEAEEKRQKELNKKQKKKTPLKIVAVICVVGVIVSTAIGKVTENAYGDSVGNWGSNDERSSWEAIRTASIDALHSGTVNFETASVQEICEYLLAQGFYVSSGELPEVTQEGTMSSQRTFTQLNGGEYTQYEISWDDWYGYQASDWHERELYFSDTRRWDDFVEDETLHSLHNEISPLPNGIEFGDTFDAVYEKLGLTDEMLAYAEDSYLTAGVSASIYEPAHVDGSVTDGSIFIYFREYTFFYSFTSNNNELDCYIVTINK